MRIGIVCKGETTSRRGFETVKIGDFGAVEIYRSEVRQSGGKRLFSRRIKKCAVSLRKLGVLMCAADKGVEDIGSCGISLVSDELRVFRENAGDAAIQFAEAHGIEADFLIVGGSFTDVTEAAKEILRFRRYVYIKNPAFDEIAAEIAETSGAVVREDAPDICAELYLCDEKKFLKYGSMEAHFSDFKIKLSGEVFEKLPYTVVPQVAAMLEMGGVLRKKEIKVEYFPK